MTALYNEIDPYAAHWLENLVSAGHIAPGRVDARSIAELPPHDLHGVTQAHFFAGIGVWSYALRLAGWPDDVPVWTGSCPCQPFSAAGAKKGFDDDRHLWPVWFDLIRECRPPVVFGEQVSSKGGLAWFDTVSADLERAGYAVGALDTSASSVGAPHIRQRLYFVALRLANDNEDRRAVVGPPRLHLRTPGDDADRCSTTRALADGEELRRGPWGSSEAISRSESSERSGGCSEARRVADVTCDRWEQGGADGRRDALRAGAERGCSRLRFADDGGAHTLGDASVVREGPHDGRSRAGGDAPRAARGPGVLGRLGDTRLDGDREHARELPRDEAEHDERAALRDHASVVAGATRGAWAIADWLYCRDGKYRPTFPGLHPLGAVEPVAVSLADGSATRVGSMRSAEGLRPAQAPSRVGMLRGYGNAIVGPLAATFIRSVMDVLTGSDGSLR